MSQFLGAGAEGRVFYNPVIPCKNPANTPRNMPPGSIVSKEYTGANADTAAAGNLAMSTRIGNRNSRFSALPFAMCESAAGTPLLFSKFAGTKTLKDLDLARLFRSDLAPILEAYRNMYLAFMVWWESTPPANQMIHGDMHHGNIMYDDKRNLFRIIDYDRTSKSLQEHYDQIDAGVGTAAEKAASKVEARYYMPRQILNAIEGKISMRADYRAGRYMTPPDPIDAKIAALEAEKKTIYAEQAAIAGELAAMEAELEAIGLAFDAADEEEKERLTVRYGALYNAIGEKTESNMAEYTRTNARLDAIDAEKKALTASRHTYRETDEEMRAQIVHRLKGLDTYIRALR